MPIKKTTKTVKDKATEPEWTTVANKAQADVPFGSMSNIQKAIIEFRVFFRLEPPKKRGQAVAPNGTTFNYYISEDLVDYADAFLMSKKMFLDTETFVTATGQTAMRFTIHNYERTEGENTKSSEISLGTPSSVSDLGARITYAQKYLIGSLFGVSVATDTDAFNNGVIIDKHETNRNDGTSVPSDVADTVTANGSNILGSGTGDKSATVPITSSRSSNDSATNDAGSVAVPVAEAGQIEHTKSYPLAKEFIVKSLSQAMLDSAVIKVTNSVSMRDEEKTELLALIEQRRTEVVN